VELRQYLRMLWGHRLLIVIVGVVGLLLAGGLTATVPPTYRSTTKLLVSSPADRADLSEAYQGDLLAKARVKTYADLVTAPPVLQAVIDRLRLPVSVASLQSRVSVALPPDTTLITVTIDDGSPDRARATAEAVAEEFANYVSGIERTAARTPDLVTVTPIQAATLPRRPVAPHHLFNLTLGVLAGLALGVAAAVLREYFDGRVRDETDAIGITEAPVLGTVPPARRRKHRRGAGYPDRDGEACRDLASVLLRLQEDRGGGPIVVLGSTRDAGGSIVAAGLARALARSEISVVLVTRTMDQPPWRRDEPSSGPDLFDVLAGHAPVSAALRPAEGEPSLLLLSADASGGPGPALVTQQVAKLLADMQERADIVLFDAPPLDESVDGAVLAACCDGALLVVRPGRTRRRDLARVVEVLRHLSTAPIGIALNAMAGSGQVDEALRPADQRQVAQGRAHVSASQ